MTLQTSQQATGRAAWPRNDAYPFRAVFFEQAADGFWTVASIFEMATDAAAHETCQELLAAYGADVAEGRLLDVHYIVGEVA